jgi:hypothetical protein
LGQFTPHFGVSYPLVRGHFPPSSVCSQFRGIDHKSEIRMRRSTAVRVWDICSRTYSSLGFSYFAGADFSLMTVDRLILILDSCSIALNWQGIDFCEFLEKNIAIQFNMYCLLSELTLEIYQQWRNIEVFQLTFFVIVYCYQTSRKRVFTSKANIKNPFFNSLVVQYILIYDNKNFRWCSCFLIIRLNFI